MRSWFGPTAAAPFYVDDLVRVPIPEGALCAWCEERIDKSDFGVFMNGMDGPLPFHWECEARQVIGSLAHIERRCSCFIPDSTCHDPPELSRREAARAALKAYRIRRLEM